MRTLLVAAEGEAGLGKDIGASQMLDMGSLGPRLVIGGLVPAQAKTTERKQMCRIGATGLESVQAAGEEEGVFGEAVVEMVVNELAQLGIDARWRRHAFVTKRLGLGLWVHSTKVNVMLSRC